MAIKNYDSWDKSRLIEEVRRLSARKKYGLVWEDKPEDVVERCKTELPVLEEVEERAIESDPSLPTNFIIEGDNYHALSVLNYTHAGKVDVIYIDPPYNTGNASWRYNNKIVDSEDAFRHSKFIAFLEKRLRLARSLLSKNGIIVVAIDDYEIQNVRLLLDEIFGEENRLGTCVVIHNPGGRQDDKFFATAHEYALFYSKDIKNAHIGHLELTEEKRDQFTQVDEHGRYKLRGFIRTGAHSRPEDRPGLYYPIFVNEGSFEISVEPHKGWFELLPLDSKGEKRVWRWGKATLLSNKEKYIECKKTKDGYSLSVKEREDDNKGTKPKTLWNNPEYSSAGATGQVKSVFSTEKIVFDYPKSIFLMLDTLKITTSKNAVVLDFFAGSGTTGHAVMALNAQDGGTRSFILCALNENRIAEEVTYLRIKNVIRGYAEVKGVPANVRYFKTTFVPKSDVSDDTRRSLIEKSTEMLCVKESTFKKVADNKKFKIYRNQEQVTGILFDLDAIYEFKEKLDTTELPASIYVFSLTSDNFSEDFDDLKIKHRIRPIPEGILEVYRKIFA